VGSIPSGPNILYIDKIKIQKKIEYSVTSSSQQDLIKFKIKLNFISLITPLLSKNLTFINQTSFNTKKIWLKQSYILLTWLYYLTFIDINKKTKRNIKIFIAPTKKKKFTLTKAPIAHKNWSKEQYQFAFYNFKITFTNYIVNDNQNGFKDINRALLFTILNKKHFPNFETNLLYLKFYQFFYSFTDKKYFNYFKTIDRR
jgi:hypothetical protein